jgi:hypothetical protein
MRVGRIVLAGGDRVTIFVGFFLVTGGYGLALLGVDFATIDLFNRRFVKSVGGIKYVCSDLSLGSLTGNHLSDIGEINHVRYITILTKSNSKLHDFDDFMITTLKSLFFVPGVLCRE